MVRKTATKYEKKGSIHEWYTIWAPMDYNSCQCHQDLEHENPIYAKLLLNFITAT